MNLFALPAQLPEEELAEILSDNGKVRVERIISAGQTSPPGFWYDQSEDEWVFLLQGKAELTFTDGSRRILRPGDAYLLPAHFKHRVSATSKEPPCIWLCIFGSLA